MAGNGTLPGLVVTGADPVDVLADFDTTTNTPSPLTSFARQQQFNADITAEINAGVSIDGFGLALQTTKPSGTISVVNDGTVVVTNPAADGLSALEIDGNGGLADYSGKGNISNSGSTPNSAALEINNSGDVQVEINAGTIAGATGLRLSSDTGNIEVFMSGGQIGDLEAPVSGDGIVALSTNAPGNFIDITAKAIFAGGTGISAENENGALDIYITANGTISADTAIDAEIGPSGGTASGFISIATDAAITAINAGIIAGIGPNSTGFVEIETHDAVTVSAGVGIRANAENGGFVDIEVGGSVDATGGNAIDVNSDGIATININSGVVAAHGAGFAGIAVSSNTGSFITVFPGTAVRGDTGISALGPSTDLTVEGTVEGTGGTAISFDPLSSNNIFELETTGRLIGSVVGSGTDTLILCGGDNAAASFDLDQISSGFTEFDKEEDTTWTVGGTLAIDTNVDEGTLRLADATIGDTQVGTVFTFDSATLAGTGTVGDLAVGVGLTPGNGQKAVLATGDGILHSGNVTFTADGTFIAHGELDVTGTVDLGGAALTVRLPLGVGVGDTFVIINNDGIDAVTSTFAGLGEGATFDSDGGRYTIHYGGGDGNDVTLTVEALSAQVNRFPSLIVSGSGPAHVAADSNVTTEDAENLFTDTITTARSQALFDDITAVIDADVTVNGWGLQIASDKTGGSVFVANHGAVVLDDPGASVESALAIFGNGGLAGYAGDGDVLNEGTFGGDGLTIKNPGDISAEISGGTINGDAAVVLLATGGAITLDMTGGQIGKSDDPASSVGVHARSTSADHQDINLTTLAIWGGDGIDATLVNGTGNITITANGAISAGFGISAGVESGGKGVDPAFTNGNIVITTNAAITAGSEAIFAFVGSGGKRSEGEAGDIAITTNAAITAGSLGIDAEIDDTATGNINITANGAITADSTGIFAFIDFAGGGKGGKGGGGGFTGGDIHITANAAIESVGSEAINVENWRGAIDIAVNANVASDAVQPAILITGEGSALVTIANGVTASGDVGFLSHHNSTTLVVAGTIQGTGAAVEFQNGTNILDMQTTGTLSGNVSGNVADTLLLGGGANAAASFDLNKIVTGFTQIEKEEDSTWTVSGTLTADTAIDQGKLVLANAIVGDTTVGTGNTVISATLAGSGTVGTLTISDKGILSPGTSAGVIHSGNVTFQSGAVFAVELGGTAAGTQYDQLDVTGTVDLGGATLNLSQIGGFRPAIGAHFTIIANDGADAVTGTYSGLAEDAPFAAGGLTYSISYHGGDGNDVVLTALGAPPTDIALSPASVPENSSNGTIVGTLSDTDSDPGDTATFTLLNNAGGRLAVSGTNLVVADGSQLNFELDTSHSVTVRVTDSGGLTFDKAFTVDLANVNEAPTGISLSNASVSENSANGTVVGALSDTDPDAGDNATFTLPDSAGGRFAVSGSNLVVANGGLLDFEHNASHSVTVRVTDSGGLTFDKAFTIAVGDVNEAPTNIALSHASVAENSANGTVMGALSDTDPDAGDTAMFTLLNNAGGRFAVSGSNLVVADGSQLNFELDTSHSVTVRVTDSGGLIFDKAFTVDLTNVNEAPTGISLSNASVSENSANGTVVGALSDTDPDAGDAATFTLLNNAGGRFAVSGSNLVVANGGLLDFEHNASHSVTVRVTDSGGLTFDKAFTVDLTNVNEAPTNITLSNASVPENSANGVVVGSLSNTDPDAGDNATFTLLDSAGGRLAISGTNLVVADGSQLNFEQNASHSVTVRATDSGGLTFDKAFTVAVTDVPETPHWMKSVDVGAHPAGWAPSGVGDFNADGSSDLAWYNSATGDVDIWKLQNGQWAGSSDVGAHPAGYQPAGFGDFNHDGSTDIIWSNPATRDIDLWKMSNAQWAGSVDIGTHPAGYAPSGVGDFNGDGTSDIAWYNPTTNDIDIWKIGNGQWAGSTDVGTHPADYQPALTGDFNGDGTSDIAWYNPSTGDVDIWKINNDQWAGSAHVGVHPLGWQPRGTGDFNEDGTSDIAWYNPATNDIDVWLIKNGQWAGSVDIGTHPGGAAAVGVGDFDHNGVSDIMWLDTATGRIDNWMLAYS